MYYCITVQHKKDAVNAYKVGARARFGNEPVIEGTFHLDELSNAVTVCKILFVHLSVGLAPLVDH